MSEMLLEELLKNNSVLRHCCWQWGSCREEQHWEEWWCLSSWGSLEILWSYWILKIINSMLKTHWKPLLKGTSKSWSKVLPSALNTSSFGSGSKLRPLTDLSSEPVVSLKIGRSSILPSGILDTETPSSGSLFLLETDDNQKLSEKSRIMINTNRSNRWI